MQKSGDKNCGITYKCLQISIIDKPEARQTMQQQFAKNIFANQGATIPVKILKDSTINDEESDQDLENVFTIKKNIKNFKEQ